MEGTAKTVSARRLDSLLSGTRQTVPFMAKVQQLHNGGSTRVRSAHHWGTLAKHLIFFAVLLAFQDSAVGFDRSDRAACRPVQQDGDERTKTTNAALLSDYNPNTPIFRGYLQVLRDTNTVGRVT